MGFPSLTVCPLDRLRDRKTGGALAAAVNLVLCAPVPTFLFIALRDGDPSIKRMVERPRSERESGAQLTIEPTDGDQCNSMQLRKAR